jgi:hypothetical protein
MNACGDFESPLPLRKIIFLSNDIYENVLLNPTTDYL